MQISIARPVIGEAEKQAVMSVLDSGQLVQGAEVEKFEQEFAGYHGARYGIATTNGTTSLMAVMMAHGIKPGDEVIIPSFSFFATASAVLSVGAIPVFADIDPDSFCLSPAAAEAAITPKTVAIMPVHLYGHPADMPAFEAICQKHGLALLEDAAQAHGAKIGDTFVGNYGSASFSFYPSKNMTSGQGRIVLTNDEDICRKLRIVRNQGMNQQYHHEMVGYNFRMTNILAAIGRVQLAQLSDWTQSRIANAHYFNENLTTVQTPSTTPGYTHVYHQYTVRTKDGMDRNDVVKRLNEQGIGARVYYPAPIHHQPVFEQYKELDLPETQKATTQVLSLPVHPMLTDEERQYIVDKVNKLC